MTFGDRNVEQLRAWERRSREKARARQAEKPRAGLKRGGPLPATSARRRASLPERRIVRAKVIARDGGCVLRVLAGHRCLGELTFHHLRKEGQGGPYTEANGVCLCSTANGAVEDDPKWARLLGLAVTAAIDPAEAARRRAEHGIAPNWRPAMEAA